MSRFKGIVHPKMNFVIIYSCSCCCVSFFLLINSKEIMLVINQLTAPIDFHSRNKNSMEINGLHQLFGYWYSSKYHPCSAEERNWWRWVNDERISIFGWNCPFKSAWGLYKVLPPVSELACGSVAFGDLACVLVLSVCFISRKNVDLEQLLARCGMPWSLQHWQLYSFFQWNMS